MPLTLPTEQWRMFNTNVIANSPGSTGGKATLDAVNNAYNDEVAFLNPDIFGEKAASPTTLLSATKAANTPVIDSKPKVSMPPITVGAAKLTYRGDPTTADLSAPVAPLDTPAPLTMPTYTAPVYDQNRVASLTQQAAAPGVRRLRQAVAEASNQSYANPNVKAMTLRQALEGFGTGLESVMSGAAHTAAAEYDPEFQSKTQESQANFSTDVNKRLADYTNMWTKYMQEMANAERMKELNTSIAAQRELQATNLSAQSSMLDRAAQWKYAASA